MKIIFKLILILSSFLIFIPQVEVVSARQAIKTVVKASPSPGPESSPQTSSSPSPSPINSYDVFWPITAGKVMGEPLYFLKTFKEKVQEFLYFTDFKKADYNVTLSEKRLVEAERLLRDKKDYANGEKTLQQAEAKRQRALDLINSSQNQGRYVTDLKNRLHSSLDNQRMVLEELLSVIPDDRKSIVNNDISSIDSLSSKIN